MDSPDIDDDARSFDYVHDSSFEDVQPQRTVGIELL